MPLFHSKVIKKITDAPQPIPQEHLEILSTWAESIRDGSIYRQKETALSGTFKDKIVSRILGYQPFSSGASNYDVFPEYPVAGGRVDLALGIFDPNDDTKNQAIATFELKGAKTKLDSIMPGRNKTPVQQAWEYAMDVKGTKWVMVSNYIEIRLYAFGQGRQDYERFPLELMTEPGQYARFVTLLSRENLLGTFTASLLEESAKQDKDVTDRLYQDYKILRHNLISNIRQHNPDVGQVQAVSYAQTILDRVLFAAFAEDKDLLPKYTLKNANDHKDAYNPRPVWDTFKALFRSINDGNPHLNIPKYNGGLFAEIPEINALDLPDSIFEGFKKLGDYDFDTEVSVNILGHIFEQSISDIEALQKGLSDLSIKTKDGKRKREGVVYTPPMITRYIVEETLGGYLAIKRSEYAAKNQDCFFKSGERKGEFKNDKSEIEYWRGWQDFLKTVKVVDPACGSGAFLVAAFDYLYDEYTTVNNRLAELHGGTGGLFDPDREILTNNLYGVDLNSESIEITKLSLWLKTAKKGKVLNSMDKNFLWGDSLIEDSNFSARAFTWKDGFADIFQQGGFDVVLGNPPYVRQEFISHLKPYLEKRFSVYGGTIDLYAYFFELGLRILKEGGRMGYICSSTFFKTGSGETLRKFLKEYARQNIIIDFGDLQIFEGVTTYPAILVMTKGVPQPEHELTFLKINKMPADLSQAVQIAGQTLPQHTLSDEQWQLEGADLQALRHKITYGRKTLKDVYGAPLYGIKTGLNEAFVIDSITRDRLIREDVKSEELIKPFLEGEDIKKWHVQSKEKFLIFTRRGTDIDKYPAIKRYLEHFRERLEPKPRNWPPDKQWNGRTAGPYEWFEIQDVIAYHQEFEKPKLIYGHFSPNPLFSLDAKKFFSNDKSFILPEADWYLLGLLQSNPIWLYLKSICPYVRGGFYEMRSYFVETIPIPPVTSKQKKVIADFAENIQKLAEDRFEIQSRVRRRVGTDLSQNGWNGKLGKALSSWWELDFKAFQAQVKKVFKRDIPLSERDQWEEYLKQNSATVKNLTSEIMALEKELNAHVYELFSLTPEEIKLVEENV